jgi:hypothetical protein
MNIEELMESLTMERICKHYSDATVRVLLSQMP